MGINVLDCEISAAQSPPPHYPRSCSRSAQLAAPSLGPACDLPPGGGAAGSVPGRGRTLREPLVQNSRPHVACVRCLCLSGLCSAAGTSQGEFIQSTLWIFWWIDSCDLGGVFLAQVCVQALIHTALWRPVDPEVEEQLAQESTVVRAFGEPGGEVRPPCGYGLLQAKEEARKVRALRSLMRVRMKPNFKIDRRFVSRSVLFVDDLLHLFCSTACASCSSCCWC